MADTADSSAAQSASSSSPPLAVGTGKGRKAREGDGMTVLRWWDVVVGRDTMTVELDEAEEEGREEVEAEGMKGAEAMWVDTLRRGRSRRQMDSDSRRRK
jgi:hypothetical protein